MKSQSCNPILTHQCQTSHFSPVLEAFCRGPWLYSWNNLHLHLLLRKLPPEGDAGLPHKKQAWANGELMQKASHFKFWYSNLGHVLTLSFVILAHLWLLWKPVFWATYSGQTRKVSHWRKALRLRSMWLQMQVRSFCHYNSFCKEQNRDARSVFLSASSSSSSLCQHKRRRHDPAETGRKHICEQCGKGFYTRDNLKVILRFLPVLYWV